MADLTISNIQQIPAFGVGAIGKNEFDPKYVDMVRSAITNGWRNIDTAEAYQTSTEIGLALSSFPSIPRSQFFITTKVHPDIGIAKNDIEGSVKKELENMKLTYVDLVLIHNPYFPKGADIESVWKEIEGLVEKGLTKYIGISNFGPKEIEKVVEIARIKPVVNQIEMHPYLYAQDKELLETAKKHSILIAAYSPLVSIGRHPTGPLPAIAEKIGQKHSVGAGQVLLKWQLQKGHMVVTNSTNPERQKQQLDLSGFELDAEDVKEIEETGAGYPYRFFGWGGFKKVYEDGTFLNN